MKVIVTKELKTRLQYAAANGSSIASNILAQLRSEKNAEEIIRGKANFFSTKRIKRIDDECVTYKIKFTVCNKDLDHPQFPDKNNPQAAWLDENRTTIEPSTFVNCFKDIPEYTEQEFAFFKSAICLASRVHLKLYKSASGLFKAYEGSNYGLIGESDNDTLHNSCMRYDDLINVVTDFYYNFVGVQIIVATDDEGCVIGRALLWKKANFIKDEQNLSLSVLDRVYFTHQFIVKLIYDYASSIGVDLRKKHNDYDHVSSFIALNSIERLGLNKGEDIENLKMTVTAKNSKWYKKGVAYLDTFYAIGVSKEGEFYLANYEAEGYFAKARKTNGTASKIMSICPYCGKVHRDFDTFCITCKAKYFISTPFGQVLKGKTVPYNDDIYPSFLFTKGHPRKELKNFLQKDKLFQA